MLWPFLLSYGVHKHDSRFLSDQSSSSNAMMAAFVLLQDYIESFNMKDVGFWSLARILNWITVRVSGGFVCTEYECAYFNQLHE